MAPYEQSGDSLNRSSENPLGMDRLPPRASERERAPHFWANFFRVEAEIFPFFPLMQDAANQGGIRRYKEVKR